ncbi:hypothetical protein AAFF_G00397880 [Aldrovandia affinis]|uniref:G-protein coupled receptors family 1 profile domain-containing protein n=1 Tax=Aldrovandia affinis TaxID=143900 RepID=A0AAD7SD57_9TELE|nr:hypothetical protein AAFF_G00397880 [Aldrovandia affinis]
MSLKAVLRTEDMDSGSFLTLDDFLGTNFSIGPHWNLEPPPVLGTPQLTALVWYGLVFLLGAPGNAIVVWVTVRYMPRSVNSQWFLQLALADLLCCLSLPLLMVPLAQDQHWPYGPLGCKLLNGLFGLTTHYSVLLLVLISLDRWLLVTRPVWCQNQRRPERARWACVVAWALALLLSLPQFLYSEEEQKGNEKVQCQPKHSSALSAWATVSLRFLLGFLLPFATIVVCHVVVYGRAVQGPGPGNDSARSQRMRRVICAVVLSFFLCWLPVHILDFLFLVIAKDSPHRHKLSLAHVLAICLAYFNSCLNPLLYVCLGRSFKDSLRQSLRGMLSFMAEDHSHGQSMSNSKNTTENTLEKTV